jgi:hypothetical protein
MKLTGFSDWQGSLAFIGQRYWLTGRGFGLGQSGLPSDPILFLRLVFSASPACCLLFSR